MIFWLFYYSLTLGMCLTILKLINHKILKVIIFSFLFSLLATPWFIVPGADSIAPVLSIFILENTILESNGLQRILRPVSAIFFISFGLTYFYYFLFKN